ncbi:MAG: biotin/lipoyl-binding protein, partial [Caulobacter sp.]
MTISKLAPVVGAALLVAACGGQGQQPPAQAPTVSYVEIKPRAVALTTELTGRTTPYESSEVRPQVNGLILARLFEEGAAVRAGQPLYRIDAAPYEAQVASAK